MPKKTGATTRKIKDIAVKKSSTVKGGQDTNNRAKTLLTGPYDDRVGGTFTCSSDR